MPRTQLAQPVRPLAGLLLALALLAAARPARAEDDATEPAFLARAGLALAQDAARSWAPDARLVYVENDEDPDGAGGAPRWGYLFHSTERSLCRSYSLAEGRVKEARDLDFEFAAPPLAANWVDSDVALAGAEAAGGREYRERSGGRLSSLVLLRGVLHPERPDISTWALIYSSPDAPSLYVLLDATSGRLVRTWRG